MTQEQIQKLLDFVSYYVTCPCCGQDKECSSDCTYHEDSPSHFEEMQQAREALK